MADVSANANPTNLAAETRKTVDNGSGDSKLLQDADRVDFIADQATYDAASFNAIRDALVTAGIMKAS